jgi:large subunit ribosomal protein L10
LNGVRRDPVCTTLKPALISSFEEGLANWRETVDRAEKREMVSTLNDVFASAGVVVVAHYGGLSVAKMTDLRAKMREAGGTVKVAKNRLAKLALDGTDAAHIADLFEGQTLIAYSDDPVAAPKVASAFAKENEQTRSSGRCNGRHTS